MKHSCLTLLGSVAFLPFAPLLRAAPSPAPVPEAAASEFAPFPDSYVEYFRRYLEDQRRGFVPGKNGKPQRLEPDYLIQATIAHKLWKKTGDLTFKAEALEDFSKTIADPKFSLASFGRLRSFGELAAALTAEGLLTPEQQQSVSQIARATLADYLKQPDDMVPPKPPFKPKPDAAVETPIPPVLQHPHGADRRLCSPAKLPQGRAFRRARRGRPPDKCLL